MVTVYFFGKLLQMSGNHSIDLSSLSAELANVNDTHVFVGPQAVADYNQGYEQGDHAGEELEDRMTILLHLDTDEAGDTVIQGVVDAGAMLSDETGALAREYRQKYWELIAPLRRTHASGTDIGGTEQAALHATTEEMAAAGLHLLGGYMVGKGEHSGTIVNSLFFQRIFSDAFKRAMVADIDESGFDTALLPPEEQARIEALRRLEDTPAMTIASASLIASLMMSPKEAFPDSRDTAAS